MFFIAIILQYRVICDNVRGNCDIKYKANITIIVINILLKNDIINI